jgi:hypothetical protein
LIKRIVIYFLLVTLTLYLVRFLHYKGLLRHTKGYYAKLKTAFNEKNEYPVVFLGSSRAEMHYNTRIFDSITGQNSFNLGLSGAMPHVAFAALKGYLANSKTPKYIIYEVDYHILKLNIKRIIDFNNYLPFLSNKTLREEFNHIDGRMNQFYYNPYYSLPYTGLKNISTGIHGWFNIPSATDELYYKGFFSENFENHLKYIAFKPVHVFIHPYNRQYLDSIITLCRAKSINLTLVTSPIFAGGAVEMINRKDVVTQVKNMARINQLIYYDLSTPVFCNQRSYFLDHQHLKKKGADVFTFKLAHIFNNKIALTTLKGE